MRVKLTNCICLGFAAFQCFCISGFANPVYADEVPSSEINSQENSGETSLIEELKSQLKKTDSFKKTDNSMLATKVEEVTAVHDAIKQEEENLKNEEIKKSQMGELMPIDEIKTENYGVCPNPGTSKVKSYMDGAKVTNTASRQYQLLQTMHINEQGFYSTDDGYIGVALGSYYGAIGTKYTVTLENGRTIKVIKADEKADIHVYNGCYHRQDGSVMEFIIDTQTAGNYWGFRNGYVLGGNFNNAEEFQGQIVDIRLVVE